MSKAIAALLDTYNSNTLWEMARAANLPGTTGKKMKKEDVIALMRREYFAEARVQASFNALSPLEKRVLNHIRIRGGEVATRLLRRELVRTNLTKEAPVTEKPKGRQAWYYRSTTMYGQEVNYIAKVDNPTSKIFEDVLARLAQRGLLFSKSAVSEEGTYNYNYKFQYHPGDIVYVPEFVDRWLPPPEPVADEETPLKPGRILPGDPQPFLRNLYLYWDAVRRQPIALIQSGFIGKRGLKAINDALLIPDASLDNARQEDQAASLYALRQILTSLGLVQTSGGELKALNNKFWGETTAVQVKQTLEAWLQSEQPVAIKDKSVQDYQAQPGPALRLLWKILGEMPADSWLLTEDLLFALQDRSVDFLFPSRSRYTNNRYYYSDPTAMRTSMDRGEAVFVTAALRDGLQKLGLVDLAADNGDNKENWPYFRLTPLGLALLRGKPLPDAPHSGQIIIQPNFQILAMGPVSLQLLSQLDAFAMREKVDATAFEYRLTRESVYTAQQNGLDAATITRFLDEWTHNELPQNVRRSLTEWAAHHERIVFRTGVSLLQAADHELLNELLADKEMGGLLARAVGPTAALIKKGKQNSVIAALRQRDILPAVSEADPVTADKTVIADADGRLRSIHAVPSVYLSGRLAPFAETAADGWRLTEKSVRRAGGSRGKVETILKELNRLCRGGLPAPLIERVKAWGGYYGSATVGHYTLIAFRDQQTMQELLQLPDLRDQLTPFPAGDRALAAVQAERLAHIQEILARLGVAVAEAADKPPAQAE
jgi:hypothetical protein